jgi:hypothetical protein
MLPLCVVTLRAQEYRARVIGTVMDQTKAAVPKATVTLRNVETGVRTIASSDGTGDYALSLVNPGIYVLSADAAGFQHWEMPNLKLDTAQELRVNISLKVGDSTTVTVSSSDMLLENSNADVTQLFDAKDVSDLPVADGNSTMLLQTLGGSVWTGNPIYTRVIDNGAVTSFRINGMPVANAFYLNGVPNNAVTGTYPAQSMAFIPPSDAVDQVKVLSNWYNASEGNSAGAVVDYSTKSGTNALHGSAFEYFSNEALNANPWISNHLSQKKAVNRSNNFGVTLGGPVVLPHLYDGHKKTFFFFFGQGIIDYLPQPTTFVVPTDKMRNGDLSEVCSAGFVAGICNDPNQQIYDPFSPTSTTGGHVIRKPLLNNQISGGELNTIGSRYITYYPKANVAGVPADGTGNFYSDNATTDAYHAWMIRLDHYIGQNQHLAFDYFASHRPTGTRLWPGVVNGITPSEYTRDALNHGFGMTDTVTLSPSMILEAHLGFNRYEQNYRIATDGFDLASLGYASSVLNQFQGPTRFPNFTISDLASISPGNPARRPGNEYAAGSSLTKNVGRHLIQFGYDGMLYRINSFNPGYNTGNFTFAGGYASQTDTSATHFGMAIADLLVGQPTSGSAAVSAGYAIQVLYHSAFVQDTWKINPKLTLTAGLRYEFEGAPTERYNQNTRGFDLTDPSPVQGAAQAAFAGAFPRGLSVASGLPVKTDFSVTGGYAFTSSQNRSFYNPDYAVFLPRLGMAYQVHDGTVLRAGVGLSRNPLVTSLDGTPGLNQAGYSQTTTMVPSTTNGLTFESNIGNPFPNGILQPTGSSLGLRQNLGGAATYFPLDPPTQYVARWSTEIQQALPGKWVFDLLYVGAKGWNFANTSNLPNAVPAAYFSTMPTRDTNLINALTRTVSNPFKGLFGTSSQNSTALNTGSTATVYQLLHPRPQFTSVSETLFNSSANFQSLQLRFMRRFAHGFSFNSVYTWSKTLQRYGFNNDFQALPNKTLSGDDVPHQLNLTFVAELPVGRKRALLSSLPRWADTIIGGWQGSGIYRTQSGEPLDFGDVYYSGNPRNLHFRYNSALAGTGSPIMDVSGFYLPTNANGAAWTSAAAMRADSRIQLAYNVRYMPDYMGNTRGAALNNLDLAVKKEFPLTERTSFVLRANFLNAFNHPWWANPGLNPTLSTFGTIDGTQQNSPRVIQLYGKLTF